MSDENLSGGAAELARLARRTLGHMSEGQRARGLEAVRGHAHRRRAERWRRVMAIGGATDGRSPSRPSCWRRACCSGWTRDRRRWPCRSRAARSTPRAPSFRARGRPSQPALRFEDGTVIKLGNETRGRLGKVDGHGAEVAIENGSAHVSVVHKPKARWLIDAGPYVDHGARDRVLGVVGRPASSASTSRWSAAWCRSRGR